jgi:TldD protein
LISLIGETLERCLETETAKGADLIMLRGQSRKLTVCEVKNGTVERFSRVNLGGVGVRVQVDNKSWGFCSTNSFEFESIKTALKSAVALGKATSKLNRRQISLDRSKATIARVKAPLKRKPDLETQEIAQIPQQASDGAQEAGAKIADVKATYLCIEDNKNFLSSEGTRIQQESTRIMLFIDVIAKQNGLLCPASENLGHTGGLELFDETPPQAFGREVGIKALDLLNARPPPSGKFPVIIHPTLCATLLHEAIGHPLEADLAMSGGGFGNRLGEQVSSRLVTIYDSGLIPRGLGYFPYDDEGVECKRTNLITQGVLESFMHDRTSAATAKTSPTGNAHAWDYSVEPLIRQTNIGLNAGDFSEEEMVEGIKEGLYLEGTFGGQADSNADFTFGFQNARWIRDGKLMETLRGANVAGNAIEVFKTVDAVGKHAVLRPGACGKFQFAVQGRVAPLIRCEIMVGGTGG